MAGNSQIIDEVVAPIAEKQVNDLKAASAALNAEFAGLLKTTIELNSQIGKVANNSKFAKAQEQAALAAEKLAAAQLKTQQAAANAQFAIDRQAAAQAKLNQVNAKAASAEAERNRLAEKRRRIVQEGTAADLAAANAQRTETAAVSQNTNALAANEAAMRRNTIAETQAEQVAARLKAERLAEAVATAEATAATAANTAAQNSNSNVFANVGRNLTRGLGYLRTLAYILPGIGIAGIFTLAFGAIEKAANALGLFNKEISTSKSNLDNFNAVTRDSAKSASESSTKLRILYKAATDVANAEENRLEAAKELQKEFPKTFANIDKETILNGGASASYNQLTKDILANAKAKAIAGKIAEVAAKKAEEEIKLLKIQNASTNQIRRAVIEADKEEERRSGPRAGGIGGSGYRVNAAQKAKTAFDDATKAIDKSTKAIKGYDDQIAFLEKAGGGNNEIAKGLTDPIKEKKTPTKQDNTFAQYLAQQREVLDSTLQYEKSTYDERLLAIDAFEQSSKILIERGVKAKEFTQIEANTKILDATNDANKERLKVESDAQKELLKLFKEGIENQKSILENSKNTFEAFNADRLLQIEKDKDATLNALADQYAKGKIKTKEYNAQKEQIERDANVATIESAIKLAQDLIKVEQELGFDTADDERKLAELQIKYSAAVRDAKLSDLKKVEDAQKQQSQLLGDIAKEAANFVIALVDAGFTNRKNALRKEQDEIETRAQAEIGAVDRSLATEQQKADKITVINAKTTAEKERIAREERKIDVEKAKFEKLASVARIIAATGVAEVQALTYLSNPFTAPLYPAIAAAIAGLGALQLATVLATPIPQYAKGTKSAKGGLSIVGERGRELVETPSGMSFLTADTAQMINLPKGSKVTPHHETMRMIGRPENLSKYSGGEQIPWREMMDIMKANKPEKNRTAVNVKVDAGFYQYRQNHFS